MSAPSVSPEEYKAMVAREGGYDVGWRYRSTRDSEYATIRKDGFEAQAQDCDGDFSRWHVKRLSDGHYVVIGEAGGSEPYHFEAAKNIAVEELHRAIKADELNRFVAEHPELSS